MTMETLVLDRSLIDELIDALGPADVRKLFDVFIAETTSRLALLGGLSCMQDRARIHDEAHSLKGAAGATGLSELSSLAAALEQAAPTITQADYATSLRRLEESFATARAEIGRVLAGMAAAA